MALLNNEMKATIKHEKESYTDISVLQLTLEIILYFLKVLWAIIVATYRLFVPVPMKSVKGEIVLITGAGSGIGRELALQYAAEGATVVSWDINEKGSLETVKEIEALGYPKAYTYVCNVSNRQQVLNTAKQVQKEVGDITILINNAGIMPCHPFLDHTLQEIEGVVNTNFMAHFWTLQAFLPAMKKNNRGHIVAICSSAGLAGLQYLVPYCASKHAVRGMMEALRQDLDFDDPNNQIKTTTIFPTMVKSGLYDPNNAKSRLRSVVPILDAHSVAQHTINAQRRNFAEATVPRHILTMFACLRLLPIAVVKYTRELVDAYVDSDLK